MESDVNLKIDTIDYNTKFLVIKAVRAQSGLYKIVAKNSVGEDTAELDLTVLGMVDQIAYFIFLFCLFSSNNERIESIIK